MQPDKPVNYWTKDSAPDSIQGNYQPTPDNGATGSPVQNPAVNVNLHTAPQTSAAPIQTQPAQQMPIQQPTTAAAVAQTQQPAPTQMSQIPAQPQAPVQPQGVNQIPAQPSPDEFKHAEPIHWTAKEYIDVDRNWLWFVAFFVVVLGLIALDIFLMKSYTFSVLVVIMAIALLIYVKRPPRDINYTLSADQGLYIGEKLLHFSDFKSFSIIKDRDYYFVMLIPIKRFWPGISVYFPSDMGEKIVDILGSRLPMEDRKLDTIDIITRKLRL